MSEIITQIVTFLSQVAGLVGIVIIVWGLGRGVVQLFKKATKNLAPFEHARLVLGQHLILGLDFLVAKDVIDTFLITDERIWVDLAKLATVVTIRIILNHFLEKEIQQLRAESKAGLTAKRDII